MLYAMNAEGELYSLYQRTLKEVDSLRKSLYFCPVCNEPLQVRAGPKTIPHFSHFPKSDCTFKQRGETVEHEKGKWALYQWLKGQGYQVQLEYYLPQIKQRPDLWLNVKNKKIAIEFQCASIPPHEINKRTLCYRKAEVFPLWILGTKHFHKSNPHQIFLNDFSRTFLYYWKEQYQLFFFEASQSRFILVSNIHSTGLRPIHADIRYVPLSEFSFSQLFRPHRHHVSNERLFLEIEKSWYKNRTVYQRKVGSEEQNYRQYLYLKGYHFSLIPSICYLPLPGQVQLGTKPYIWQTRLFVDHLLHLPIGAPVKFPPLNISPTLNGYVPDLSGQYINMLTQLNIIEKTGENNYIKKKQVLFHTRMEDALEDDLQMLHKLKKLQRIKI
ncbi:Competence protein CoiA-like family, contains a predicted nuclease domain [Halobacillus karajensis]|uniref:competence protein CoiA n=1 Tax=Halobacillus karajensis TaxID=195088 RepID=UPI0008A80AB5|nr:competence protein CoiA family protein [Halobacillus karajensis]SEH97402.1 Competence protein CoiA-like family, contains a predicted nuclease domain [Halobacillus karajensis]